MDTRWIYFARQITLKIHCCKGQYNTLELSCIYSRTTGRKKNWHELYLYIFQVYIDRVMAIESMCVYEKNRYLVSSHLLISGNNVLQNRSPMIPCLDNNIPDTAARYYWALYDKEIIIWIVCTMNAR